MQLQVAGVPAAKTPAAGDRAVELLAVDVAGRRCALPVEAVVEIHAAVQLAPLPDAPAVVAGLMNRRGSALPVLDLRSRLGLAPRPMRLDDRLVVLRLPDRTVALLVDAVIDVLTVTSSAVDSAVTAAASAAGSSGVAVLPDGLLVIVDVNAFLSPGECSALDEALQQALSTW